MVCILNFPPIACIWWAIKLVLVFVYHHSRRASNSMKVGSQLRSQLMSLCKDVDIILFCYSMLHVTFHIGSGPNHLILFFFRTGLILIAFKIKDGSKQIIKELCYSFTYDGPGRDKSFCIRQRKYTGIDSSVWHKWWIFQIHVVQGDTSSTIPKTRSIWCITSLKLKLLSKFLRYDWMYINFLTGLTNGKKYMDVISLIR